MQSISIWHYLIFTLRVLYSTYIPLNYHLLAKCFGPLQTPSMPYTLYWNVPKMSVHSVTVATEPKATHHEKTFQMPTAKAKKPLMSFKCARNSSFFWQSFWRGHWAIGIFPTWSTKTTWAIGHVMACVWAAKKAPITPAKKKVCMTRRKTRRNRGGKNQSWKTVASDFWNWQGLCHICQC